MIGTWWALPALQDLPAVPDPKTQAEAILMWVLGVALVLAVGCIVALFRQNQSIHFGHKEKIQEVEAAHTRSVEQNWELAFETVQKTNEALAGMVERTATANSSQAAAVTTLTQEMRESRKDLQELRDKVVALVARLGGRSA